MSIHEDPMAVLSESECWDRVATQVVGRLVTSVGEVIDVVPVNFVVDRRAIVFRTAAGSKLAGLTVNSSVLFEVDEFDDDRGWSVVLHGQAQALETEGEVAAAERLPLKPFVSTLKPTFVRVEVDSVTGRSFVFGEEPKRENVQEG